MFARMQTAVLVVIVALMTTATTAGPPASARPDEADGKKEKQDPKQAKDVGKRDPPGKRAAGSKSKGKRSLRRSRARPRNLAVKAMKTIVEDAEIVDLTFEEFCEWLGRATGANVVVRWKVLEREGVERDDPVALKEENIRVRRLLVRVFEQVAEGLPAVELAAKAEGNTLIISTRKNLSAKRITRVYDVQNLLVSVPQFTGSAIGDLGLGEDGGFRLRKPRFKEDKSKQIDPIARRLIDLITTHVQPSSWKANGGKGSIRYYKGRLIVYNSLEVHQQLGGAVSTPPGRIARSR